MLPVTARAAVLRPNPNAVRKVPANWPVSLAHLQLVAPTKTGHALLQVCSVASGVAHAGSSKIADWRCFPGSEGVAMPPNVSSLHPE
jgi:hypothetical protein